MLRVYHTVVGNIGTIGEYTSLDDAKRAGKDTLANSARADRYFYILDGAGELIFDSDDD